MFQRGLIVVAALVIVCSLSMFIPSAQASPPDGCTPTPGAGSTTNNLVTCDGDDANGVNVGSGDDEVQIISGTVLDTIFSEGGALLVTVNGGALNTSVAETTAIFMDGSGDVTLRGDLTASCIGIHLNGDGHVDSVGDINAGVGILLVGDGQIDSTGDIGINSGSGISIDQYGQVTCNSYSYNNYGIGLFLYGSGNIISNSNISGSGYGIIIVGDGQVISNGDIAFGEGIGIGIINNSLGDAGGQIISNGSISIGDGVGIELLSPLEDGQITSNGDISIGSGIAIEFLSISGDAQIISNGDVNVGTGIGIMVIGNAQITSNGNINIGSGIGIQLLGDGAVTINGNITSGVGSTSLGSLSLGGVGVLGGPGDQHLELQGTIDTPIAVLLGEGDDSFYVHNGSSVQGTIEMEGGDDTVQIGDYAVVSDTVYGGETAEVFGDLLIIGDGLICTEDGEAVATAQGINALDPNSGTVTYLGQTYTWAEFEQIAAGGHLQPCVGKIHDGRVNAYDLGAPEALYCVQGGGLSVWDIDSEGNGTFSFVITTEQIDAAFEQAVASQTNTVIGSDDLGNVFYALSDGHTITFTAPDLNEPGKTYQYSFERDSCIFS